MPPISQDAARLPRQDFPQRVSEYIAVWLAWRTAQHWTQYSGGVDEARLLLEVGS